MIESKEQMDEKHQTLVEHLGELRSRIIFCAYALIIATALCYSVSDKIFNFIRAPIAPYLQGGGLVFTGPMDKFVAHLKLSFACGVIVSCPFWLYQVWLFVAPGLYARERKYSVGFIVTGTVLFLLGVAFSYFVVLPMAFHFLMNYGGDIDKPMITIDHYMGFFTQICLVFGAAFEMPLVIIILGMLGVVSQEFLRAKRRFAIMTIAILSAIITPPDLLSMVLMLLPMVLLFEIAVFFVGFFEKKNTAALVNERE